MKKLLLLLVLSAQASAYETFTELAWHEPPNFGTGPTHQVAGFNVYCKQIGVDTEFIAKLAGITAMGINLDALSLTQGRWECLMKQYNPLGIEENYHSDIISFNVVTSGGVNYYSLPPPPFQSLWLKQ